ncbi:MAG: hypothetical protein K6360_09375 [Deltaproteobacteria bacterium]
MERIEDLAILDLPEILHSSRDPVVSITQVEWLVCDSRSKATQFQIAPSPDRESLASSTGEFYANAVKDFIHLRMGRWPPRKRRYGRTDKTLECSASEGTEKNLIS